MYSPSKVVNAGRVSSTPSSTGSRTTAAALHRHLMSGSGPGSRVDIVLLGGSNHSGWRVVQSGEG